MSKEKEEEVEERRERKEGVRGWRSNKELLRYDRQTATTWPHYGRFSPAERLSFHRRLSFPSSLFSLAPLDFRSRVMPFYPYPYLAHETFQTRQYVMFENPRATPSSSGCSTWNRRFYPTLYISVDAQSKPRWDRSTL